MGKYSDSTRSNDEECMLCPIGSYSPLPMSGALNTDCTTCESGKVMPVSGAGTCVECNSGNTSAQKCVCGAGKESAPILLSGSLPEAATLRVRLRDSDDASPTFDSKSTVKGQVEVLPVGSSAWGTTRDKSSFEDTKWDGDEVHSIYS